MYGLLLLVLSVCGYERVLHASDPLLQVAVSNVSPKLNAIMLHQAAPKNLTILFGIAEVQVDSTDLSISTLIRYNLLDGKHAYMHVNLLAGPTHRSAELIDWKLYPEETASFEQVTHVRRGWADASTVPYIIDMLKQSYPTLDTTFIPSFYLSEDIKYGFDVMYYQLGLIRAEGSLCLNVLVRPSQYGHLEILFQEQIPQHLCSLLNLRFLFQQKRLASTRA